MPDRKQTLVDAGLRINKSYHQTLRLLMIGSLTGGRDEKGQLFIYESSIDRYLKLNAPRASEPAQPAPAA